MKNEEIHEKLEKLISEILTKMTFADFRIESREEKTEGAENSIFNIVTKDSNLLIGQQGITLQALQHLVRAVARKLSEERLKFVIDVNEYRRQKTDSLEDLAKSMAKQAIDEKRPVVMRPMSAYERRIIHLTLATNSSVKTESIGEDEERKVVIKPVGVIEEIN
ncbi:MAG: R3H domain-containing nucleic acid-binding protein [Parcubacteria group bacterium]|jgi:spoIIIJ-associated protein